MGVRYYKLFDLLNRRGMKKSDLRSVISSATVAKLSKGEYISFEALEKICKYLKCQPGDIMEIVEDETGHINDITKEEYYITNELGSEVDIDETINEIIEIEKNYEITHLREHDKEDQVLDVKIENIGYNRNK